MSMLALIEGVGLNLKELGLAESESKKLDYKRLGNDISKKIERWNERSLFTLAGVKRLSLGDLNTLMMCCQYYESHGTLDGIHPFNPAIWEVLDRYSIEEE